MDHHDLFAALHKSAGPVPICSVFLTGKSFFSVQLSLNVDFLISFNQNSSTIPLLWLELCPIPLLYFTSHSFIQLTCIFSPMAFSASIISLFFQLSFQIFMVFACIWNLPKTPLLDLFLSISTCSSHLSSWSS